MKKEDNLGIKEQIEAASEASKVLKIDIHEIKSQVKSSNVKNIQDALHKTINENIENEKIEIDHLEQMSKYIDYSRIGDKIISNFCSRNRPISREVYIFAASLIKIAAESKKYKVNNSLLDKILRSQGIILNLKKNVYNYDVKFRIHNIFPKIILDFICNEYGYTEDPYHKYEKK